MARFGWLRWLLTFAMAGSLATGCYVWRSASADSTVWNELPNDPRPELWVEGEPKVAVVFEGVYRALGDAEPSFDPQATEFYRRGLRDARVFTEILEREATATGHFSRVRMERRYREDDHLGANLAKAATVPGLLGYRFELIATLRLELERPDGDPIRYEARSALTRIYHHSGNRDRARRLVYAEADRANTDAVLHQLRADPALFEPETPLVEPSPGSAPAEP